MSNANKKFRFGTKSETLEKLNPTLSLSSVPKLYYFTVEKWFVSPEEVLKEIMSVFEREKIIIRSSAYSEDSISSSSAGLHDSVANISSHDRYALTRNIDRVISSYNRTSRGSVKTDQVLIQLMVNDVSMSGVIFTQDMNTGIPYYVINYDDQTGATDTITAGRENSNRTLVVHRNAVCNLRSGRFKALFSSILEIERTTNCDSLDIEFAVDKDDRVYIFQVRRIAARTDNKESLAPKVDNAIRSMSSFLKAYGKAPQGVYGRKTILGKMPDWNPAEMIGTSPRPLALSLYRYLITDHAWRQARKQMGYNEPPQPHLMLSLFGKPYIDARLSFNSLLPSGLSPVICERVVDACLSRLSAYKEFHDKIEFEIAITALTFDFEESMNRQFRGILNNGQKMIFKESLFNLTNSLLNEEKSPIEGELKKIAMLQRRRDETVKKAKKTDLNTACGLLEDCIKLGTVPFAILARHAFIAKSFVRSMINREALTEAEALSFENSMKTVAGDLVCDIKRFAAGAIDIRSFMAKYGHLRAGTYDILSRRYDQRLDLLNGVVYPSASIMPDKIKRFSFSPKKLRIINRLLEESGFDITPLKLIDYITRAIPAREHAKFIFTKNISDALEIIALWAEGMELTREDVSYLNIKDILGAVKASGGSSPGRRLRDLVQRGRDDHEVTLAIRLPYLIEGPEDISVVPLFLNKPNFVTHKIVRAPYVFIDGKSEIASDMDGKIVLIEGADPGFDWIFSRPISGLITKFGGANSHMAIRCAEFGLPAAIGCGEQIFDRILRSRTIELNCSERRIEPIEV